MVESLSFRPVRATEGNPVWKKTNYKIGTNTFLHTHEGSEGSTVLTM